MEEKTAKGTAIINKGEEREEDRSGGSGAQNEKDPDDDGSSDGVTHVAAPGGPNTGSPSAAGGGKAGGTARGYKSPPMDVFYHERRRGNKPGALLGHAELRCWSRAAVRRETRASGDAN